MLHKKIVPVNYYNLWAKPELNLKQWVFIVTTVL
jgi:hypothetical protein